MEMKRVPGVVHRLLRGNLTVAEKISVMSTMHPRAVRVLGKARQAFYRTNKRHPNEKEDARLVEQIWEKRRMLK